MSKMELEDFVAEKLELISNRKDDPEVAHYEEKELWEKVLEAAAGGYDVTRAAKEALKTRKIDFPRWYA